MTARKTNLKAMAQAFQKRTARPGIASWFVVLCPSDDAETQRIPRIR